MKKVVTAQEMVRLEKLAVEQGASIEALIRTSGQKIAAAAIKILQKKKGANVALLIGPGNKGADAYVAGTILQEAGYNVRAFPFYPLSECSEHNRYFAKQFIGKIDTDANFAMEDLLIDGLFGTGFHGTLPRQELIDLVNISKKPILAIDIPSGLDGTTGVVNGPAIKAMQTITLGFAKLGLFRGSGWDCAGKIDIEEVGFSQTIMKEAKAIALIAQIEELSLPPMVRSYHKYERGCVVGFGGSEEFKGAVKLSGSAALHAGAGIVKLFTMEDVGTAPNELICQIWNEESWIDALVKASSVFIGPGLGRSSKAKKLCKAALQSVEKPCVIDADALFFLGETAPPKHSILTPHRGEVLYLLGLSEKVEESQLWIHCQSYVDKHSVVLILKGAPTHIFSPNHLPIIIPRGDPGMATAGSGDVLTGILSALLAQGQPLLDAAVLGVFLHDLSGEAAAEAKTSYGYSSSDLIDYLPTALKHFTK